MSCAYWRPKSTTRTGRWSVSFTLASLRGALRLGHPVPRPAGRILVTPRRDEAIGSVALLVLQGGATGEIGLDALVGPALTEEGQHRHHAEEHQQQHARQAPAHLHPQIEAEDHVDHVDQAVDR